MTILQTLLDLEGNPPGQRAGPAGQRPRRALEQRVRLRAVCCAARLAKRGVAPREAARRLAVSERTLRSWNQAVSGDRERLSAASVTPVAARGRPLARSDAAHQQAVVSWLEDVGPGVGLPTLGARFADLARAELDELLQGYRCGWREAHRQLSHVLHWQRPGTVWAMDFAVAPCTVDGLERYLLAVRDLASGEQLLWQPVAAMTAEVVMAELTVLFAVHGAPLVLKTDNGSAFIADVVRWFLRRWGVGQLFSPPWTPGYNGAIEASIGSLKIRTARLCLLAGYLGVWPSALVEAARLEANLTARPRRLRGLTPEQVWEARRLLTPADRAGFQATVEQERSAERARRGLPEHDLLTRTEQAAVDRVAFSRALVAHDLLLFRRRRILPRIRRPKVATEG